MGRRLFVLILLLGIALPLSADKAHSAYNAGVDAETHNRMDAAYEAYKRAYDLKPKDPRYISAYTRLRFYASAEHLHKGEVLVEANKLQLALSEFLKAVQIDSGNTFAQQEAQRTQQKLDQIASHAQAEIPESPLADQAEEAEGPVELQPVSKTPITLRMTENTKVIYKTIGSLAGINIIFDPEYTARKITIEMDSVQLSDALEIVALASKTFWRPVTANTIYVAAETAGKRREVEQSVMKTFYLNNVSATTDLADAATTIRSILDITRVQPVQSQNALIVRATPEQLVLAEKLLADIDKAKPEVMVDVAILEVTRDRLRTLGSTLPTSTTIAIQGNGSSSGGGASSGSSLTLNSLSNLNASNFLISIPSASFTALMSDSNTKIIQNPQVRVLDNQQATLKIGDRVPIATGSFSPGIGGAGISPLVNTQFQYLDVGVNITITPRIHSRSEVTLKLGMEVSSVTGQQNIGGVSQPIIGQRRIEHETRLREGEVNLLGGILEDSESDSISGYPWLIKIPLLKYLFGQDQKQRTQREIVFAITPHIVRAQDITRQNQRAIDVGTPSVVGLRREIAAKTTTSPGAAPETAPQKPATQMQGSLSQGQQQRSAVSAPNSGTQPGPAAQSPTKAERKSPPGVMGNVNLSFEPTTVAQLVGSTFTVSVNVSGAQNAFSIPLQINYDPKLLQIVDVSNGGFLNQDGQTPALVFRSDPVKGSLQITATRPPASSGVSGSGQVFILTLSAKAVGETVLDISGASVLDPKMQATAATGGDLLVTLTGEPSNPDDKSATPTAPQPKMEPDRVRHSKTAAGSK